LWWGRSEELKCLGSRLEEPVGRVSGIYMSDVETADNLPEAKALFPYPGPAEDISHIAEDE
jgi:hypothetical protein